MFTSRFSAKEKRIFLSAVFLFFLFFVLRLVSNIYTLSDSKEYLELALRLGTKSYYLPVDNYSEAIALTKRPIVYPLFLSFFSKFSVEFIILIQTLFGILNIYLSFLLLKKLNLKPNYFFLLFLIITPSIFVYTQLIMSEWLVMTFLLLLSNLLFLDFSKRNFFLIQLITILLAFTKPVFYPFIYFNLIYFAIFLYKKRSFNFSLFLPILVLVSYLYFNEYRTGYKHFSSIQNINFIDYNLYLFKSKTEGQVFADNWLEGINRGKDSLVTMKEKNVYIESCIKKEITTNFIKYSWYHFITSLRGIIDPGRFDLMTFFAKEDGTKGFLYLLNSDRSFSQFIKNKYSFVYLLLIPIFIGKLIKFVLAILYMIIEAKKRNFLKIYLFILLIYTILITGPVNSSRYLMPFELIYIAFAMWSIKFLIKKKIIKD